ncbi:antibiotic biosynthesis monooxygenase [Hoeflea sp. TYP-13]|uniref:antibiotic biosynthesis monooxygenase n=1 Tax=Hoeflea sp. TYP-13 TaxID=3230023 RepID=UPI0034C699E0
MTQNDDKPDWSTAPCAFFCEYKVYPDKASAFEALYGSTGEWARLFQCAEGYLRTELLRDPDDPSRYRTADYWQSREDFLTFLRDYSEQYDSLGVKSSGLASEQTNLGMFLAEA